MSCQSLEMNLVQMSAVMTLRREKGRTSADGVTHRKVRGDEYILIIAISSPGSVPVRPPHASVSV